MLVREYRQSDLDALRAIHAAQGFDYALPDLRNPLFVTKLVLCGGDAPPVAQGESPPWSGQQPDSPAVFSSVGAQPCPERQGRDAPPQSEHHGESTAHAADSRTLSSDHIVGAALLRLTAEAYLLLEPRAGTPRQRWQWLVALHEAARQDAWQRGLEDVHAWLPPRIAEKFGRRLARLGWRRDDSWTPYSKKLGLP